MDLSERVELAISQVKQLYFEDEFPWLIGYSGGKDSTTVLQLVWNAISEIEESKRNKKIYVITTDTLVENPIVAKWVETSLNKIQSESQNANMGITSHRLVPVLGDRFWVNLIGKGYPTPRQKFRWCTSRLKINASTEFIRRVVSERGEAILFLGTRSAESAARKKVMEKHAKKSTRELLSRNTDPRLDRAWIFPLIKDWSNDEVWEYLIENENPWKHSNIELFHLYKGASPDSECPLVVDSNTPSCGDSRFGCYVCTMVDKDKSLAAMIKNDSDKIWMMPLSDFRDKKLNKEKDHQFRDFRRLKGNLDIYKKNGDYHLTPGPYKQSYRKELLEELLIAQKKIRDGAPEDMKDFEVISLEEMEEIRRIWVEEKSEIEDQLPKIYKKVLGEDYPLLKERHNKIFSEEDLEVLRSICKDIDDPDEIQYQMIKEMIQIEFRYQNAVKRDGIYDLFEKSLKKHAFVNREEALKYRVKKKFAEDGLSDEETEAEVKVETYKDEEKKEKANYKQPDQLEIKS